MRKQEKASLTLEAAIVLPLFLLFMTAILCFEILIGLQSNVQLSMEEAARNIGKRAYLAEHLTAQNAEDGGESDSAGVLSVGINSLTIKSMMMKNGLSDVVGRSRIRGGPEGFYVYHSGYDRKQGILDIVVNYTYVFPFLPESFGAVRFAQRSRSHVWTGKRLKDRAQERKESAKTVYVTPSGTVYHLSTACPYLDLSVRGVLPEEADALRNKDGKIYYECPDCGKDRVSEHLVYVTDYGTRWHSDLQCSGLKRTVEAVDLSSAGGKHVCSRCAELFGNTEGGAQ